MRFALGIKVCFRRRMTSSQNSNAYEAIASGFYLQLSKTKKFLFSFFWLSAVLSFLYKIKYFFRSENKWPVKL